MRGFFALKEQKQRSCLSQLMKNIQMSSDWLRVGLLLSEISHSMAWKTTKPVFIHDRQRKRSVRSIKDKNEDADDIAFQCQIGMQCRIQMSFS